MYGLFSITQRVELIHIPKIPTFVPHTSRIVYSLLIYNRLYSFGENIIYTGQCGTAHLSMSTKTPN